MVQGIETDSKKYKHIKRDDEKWLSKDLRVIKKTVEKYIDDIRPNYENEIDKSEKKSKKKMMTIDRIIAILFLGIFGLITLITGIYLIIKNNYLLGAPLGIFGAVFVITFYLFEKYR